MQTTPLPDGWTVAATSGDLPDSVATLGTAAIPAIVPGCVHTDLLEAGLIADPYVDGHERDVQWMFDVDWRYARPLVLDPAADTERVDLVFDGIDTVSTVHLGHERLGLTANMHRSYRFDVRWLADGVERPLTVDLQSATRYALAESERLGSRPAAYHTPFNFVRKMACSFGWDWGPDLRTAGLWREVRVERWSVARLAEVRPLVTVGTDRTGHVEVQVDVERSGREPAGPLGLVVEVLGHQARVELAADAETAVIVVDVPDAPLWWPVGHGAQPLAELVVTLSSSVSESGRELQVWRRRIGFRTVELDTTDDEFGSAFTITVNGRAIFAKGFNWIPDDHFVSRLTRERLERRIDQAVAANANLLRVWGGGIYESEDFYSVCDERGVLVWQDFLLACAAYPEESPLFEEIKAEARENVVRLMPHPSLVLWNGGNENLWGHEDWGWPQELEGRSWGARYPLEVFPAILAELDPTRPYNTNSPSSPEHLPGPLHPNDPDHGTYHEWEVWNRVDYHQYRADIPRFCSEFGFQAPPTWRTLSDFVHATNGQPLTAVASGKTDPTFLLHQKAEDGNAKLDRGMAPHLGVPENFVDWHWAAQLNQARAVSYAVEHYRSWWPRTAGAIVWQLNDCWPVTSWAAIDSMERPKPLWHALRHAFAPRLLTVVHRDGALAVAVINDTDEPWSGRLTLRREGFGGEVRADVALDVTVAARAVEVVPVPAEVAEPKEAEAEVLVVRLGSEYAVHTYVEDVAAHLDPDPLEVAVTRIEGGYRVQVSARSLVRDLILMADRLAPDASVDHGLVDLPAGTSAVFIVRTAAELDPTSIGSAHVLRTANDLQSR
jgi:beta-mannosidase